MASQDLRFALLRAKLMADSLPSFARPPLVETVLGFQFDPLEDLVPAAHLGAFWASLGDPWTKVAQVPPLGPVEESFDEGKQWRIPGLRLGVTQDPGSRLQIVRPDNDHMVQVQNGWFVYNWRLTAASTEYPRYSRVRTEFDAMRNAFTGFLRQQGLGSIRPNLWEVTYVNHLDRGALWQRPEDWPRLLPGLLGAQLTSAVVLEGVGCDWRYVIGEQVGRLHVSLKHGRRHAGSEGDYADTLVLKFTARGSIYPDIGDTSLGAGLDEGRRAIVCTFADVTSDEAHKEWGRE